MLVHKSVWIHIEIHNIFTCFEFAIRYEFMVIFIRGEFMVNFTRFTDCEFILRCEFMVNFTGGEFHQSAKKGVNFTDVRNSQWIHAFHTRGAFGMPKGARNRKRRQQRINVNCSSIKKTRKKLHIMFTVNWNVKWIVHTLKSRSLRVRPMTD